MSQPKKSTTTKKAKARAPAATVLQRALAATNVLAWKPGLQAVTKGEGHGQIKAKDPVRLLGGAAIDTDCRATFPQSARWDYVLGYDRGGVPIAYFVEVHSAHTGGVSDVRKKLSWLTDYLKETPQKQLDAMQAELWWVASGAVRIPKNTPQYRELNVTLRKLGLQGPVSVLELA